MSEPFIGEIRIVGFNFAPIGWATCSGQLMSIAQNTALFALIGTTYGGDGQTTFALPDFRSRVGVSQGQGPGLSNYVMGEMTGTEAVTLLTSQIPAHTHTMAAESNVAGTTNPTQGVFGAIAMATKSDALYSATNDNFAAANAVSVSGGNQPHPNIQPFLAMNYIIALEGIFPSRN